MNLNTEKRYRVIIELTEEEVKELYKESMLNDRQTVYCSVYESTTLASFKRDIFDKLMLEFSVLLNTEE